MSNNAYDVAYTQPCSPIIPSKIITEYNISRKFEDSTYHIILLRSPVIIRVYICLYQKKVTQADEADFCEASSFHKRSQRWARFYRHLLLLNGEIHIVLQ